MSEALTLLFGGEPAASLKTAAALRALVLRVIPAASEKVRVGWNLLGFDAPGFFVFISPYQRKVRLGFMRGPLLYDPLDLLEGDGTYVRWITFTKPKEVTRVGIEALIKQAFSFQCASKKTIRRKSAPPKTQ
jgi:hypothetical protein